MRAARTAPSSTGSTHMMNFDYGGDGEPRGNAQLGLHHHPRVVHPPLKRRRGQLCCLSARPPDLADLTAARPEVACVLPSYVSCLYSKRAALTRSPSSFSTSERFVRFSSRPLVEPPTGCGLSAGRVGLHATAWPRPRGAPTRQVARSLRSSSGRAPPLLSASADPSAKVSHPDATGTKWLGWKPPAIKPY